MRRAAAVILVLAGLGAAGCSADGNSTKHVTFDEAKVPFTFRLPPDFTDESVDELNSRGDVVAVRALDKVNVLAVRRVPAGTRRTETRAEVLGKPVRSRVVPVPGAAGWALECQYTADRASTVLDACAEAERTLRRR